MSIPKPPLPKLSPKKYRVLIVDDGSGVVASLEGVLPGNVDVATATSGAEALSIFARQEFHVVCSDYTMPGMNGIELLRRISERPTYTSCLLVTGADEYFRSSESGRYYVLLKPFDPERLVGIVLQLARVAEMKRQLVPAARAPSSGQPFVGEEVQAGPQAAGQFRMT